MSFLIGPALSIGASLIGNKQQKSATAKADNSLWGAQSQNAANFTGFQNATAADQAPYQDTGRQALTGFNQFMSGGNLSGVLANDPVYNARLSAGTQAIDQSAAARGGLFSGGTLKALTRFGQQTGSDELNNIFSRYNTGVGVGQAANSSLQAGRLAAANGIGEGLYQTAKGVASNATTQGQNNATATGNIFGSNGVGSIFNSVSSALGSGGGGGGSSMFGEMAGLF